MNAHTPRILTDAETSLVEAFDVADWLTGNDDVKAKRSASIEALKSNGLPTRRVEAFHYTDLRAAMAKDYAPSPRPAGSMATHAMVDFERLVTAVRFPMVNGHYFADLSGELPEGVTAQPGIAASSSRPLDASVSNTVELINNAFVTDGISINIAPSVHIGATLTIANSYVGMDGGMAVTRNSVVVEKGAKARLLDRYCGDNATKYLSSNVVDIELHEGAELDYILAIEEGTLAQRLSRMNVKLSKGATLNLFVLNAGGKFVRQELNFSMEGEGADLNIFGINLVGGEAHIDVTSSIVHKVANTTANEIFRNVVTGRGKGVFQGQIKVAQPAQLTDARMACNTLLLSDDCDFSAKPELEIFADDVQCAHGATVADLEKSYLFYLMARGISEDAARRMLVKAFVVEVFEGLDDQSLAEALDGRIDVWMENHI